MRPLRALSLCLLLLPVWAAAQTFDEYLKLRKQYGVTQPAGVVAIETFVGERVLEVRGVVQGFVGSGESTLLILDNPEGQDLFIRATRAVPDWLKGNQVPARLLVKARRLSDNGLLEAELLGAAVEGRMSEHDRQLAEQARRRTQTATSRTTRPATTSRSGGRPAPLPGDIPPVTGPIGQIRSDLSADLIAVLPAYTQFIQNRNRRLDPAKAQHIAETILGFSSYYGVDARLIMAIVMVESGFNPSAQSHAGAQGLGQLMPGTARGLGVTNSFDTEQNLYGTVRLIRGHIDRYHAQTGDAFEGLILALAAYNAGSGAVRRHGGVPPFRETQNYIRKVISAYRQLTGS